MGAGENYSVGETGGEKEVTLTVEQMPSHSHKYDGFQYAASLKEGTGSNVTNLARMSYSPESKNTGGSQPHNNMPPYYTLCYIMKI